MPTHVLNLPASAERENEDAVALGDGLAVVVDGAGLPKSLRQGCAHSVAWYSHSLADSFARRLADPNVTMVAALADAIAAVTAAHSGTCALEAGSPSATAAAWRVAGPTVEYLVLCDTSVVVAFADGGAREITDDRVETVVSRRAAELLAERGVAEPFDVDDVIAARFAALEQTRNRDGGFWCCQTDPHAALHALTGSVPLDALASITAASDGGTRGFQWLGAHTLERFAALATAGDLATIGDEIRAAEDAYGPGDARAAKPHDDLTLVTLVTLARGDQG